VAHFFVPLGILKVGMVGKVAEAADGLLDGPGEFGAEPGLHENRLALLDDCQETDDLLQKTPQVSDLFRHTPLLEWGDRIGAQAMLFLRRRTR
jgi:hypothetical protein